MKKFSSSIFGIIITACLLVSCRKADNPKIPALTRVPVPVLTLDNTASTVIAASSPATFNGKFSVDLYFKNDIKPKQIDIVVAKNHHYGTGSVKLFKTAITTYPTDVTVSGTQLVTIFATPIVVGDVFEFGANITLDDGTILPAFDSVGAAYGQTGGNVDGFPNANLFITYNAICSFDQSQFSGPYKIITDGFADYETGDPVTVNPGPGANQVSITVYPGPLYGNNRKPFIIDIDPATGKASGVQQVIGDYPPNDLNMSIATTPGAGSFVDFCTGKIHLSLDFSDAYSGAIGTVILEIGK